MSDKVGFNCPIADARPDEYAPRHLDVQLTTRQSIAMQRLFIGLDRDGARLLNDRRVVTAADAIRWLLEQVPEENG